MPHRILVADDNEQVRRSLVTILGEVGYLVTDADTGKEALRSIKLASKSFCLLITDLVMPDMEGLELISLLRKSHPKLPIVAISGEFHGKFLHAASLLDAASVLGANATLHKPFKRSALLATVESVLPKTVSSAFLACT